jgi:tetratricopeptide (TPR) repeat protein
LAEKLPKERANERRLAYQSVGHVFFAQLNFGEALRYYSIELRIGLSSLQPYEAELAYAYHDVALSFHALGRLSEAAENYAKAEQTMSQARDHIGLDELKPRYSITLKQIRQHYLILLQQSGQTAAAADLEKTIHSEVK